MLVASLGLRSIKAARPQEWTTQLAPGCGAANAPASSTTAYSHVMNWSDPTKAYAVPRSVALRDQVYAPQGVTGESCVIEG